MFQVRIKEINIELKIIILIWSTEKIHGTIIEIFVEEFLDTGIGSLSKKYSSQQIDPDTLETRSQKLEYEDEFLNMGKYDYWILNSRTIKYINQNQEEETQKFVFEDLCLLN